jgi:hypothetical protein
MAKKVTLSEAIVYYAVKDKPVEMTEPLIIKLNGMVKESVGRLSGEMAKNLLLDTPLLEDFDNMDEEVELTGALADAVEHVINAVEENGLDNIGEAVNEAAHIHGCSMEELENWVESALENYCAESVEETKNEDIENITYQPYGESMLSSMRESVNSDTDVVVSFENKTASRVSPVEAKAMLEVYNQLSVDNKLFFVESASKNVEGFRKVLGFSIQVLGAN